MAKPKEMNIELIDKNNLIKQITYNAFIGGEERLLTLTEMIALIEQQHVWSKRIIKLY